MLFTLGCGQKIVLSTETAAGVLSGLAPLARTDVVSYAQATANASSTVPSGATAMPQCGTTPGGPFGYLFPDAPTSPADGTTLAKLDALADAMVETANDPPQADSAIPPVFTYFGQFIDQDITANTDREGTQSIIEPWAEQTLNPLPRSEVTSSMLNLRKGSLGPDNLYGDGPDDGQAAMKLETPFVRQDLQA